MNVNILLLTIRASYGCGTFYIKLLEVRWDNTGHLMFLLMWKVCLAHTSFLKCAGLVFNRRISFPLSVT